ncbi:TonB-dependent receptor [Novosphingobium rosa]|uniref:TonB-dependent receptor n=1 Tax=Novosphingobium rosa TaxID=76978 RepID=UPI001471B70B|nr:TonB-dependent receptor plug domain-containing protein [Novosphingobium rosa]
MSVIPTIACAGSDRSAPADDTGPPVAQSDTRDIVVTARRKEESLQSVPVAVVAFGQETIANRQIKSEGDLQRVVPGLTIRETEGSNQVAYSIRGQTIDAFTGSALAVVPYVNEVQANGNAASNFYDLESIQALKGPQGTLFGRNSTGGAVLFATAKPVNKNTGSMDLSYGNYNYVDAKAMANLVLINDKLLLRVAGNYSYRDGYQKNVFNSGNNLNPRLGILNRGSGRVSLLARPTDSITNTTVFEYTQTGGNSTSVVPWSVNAPGSVDPYTGQALSSSSAFLYSPLLDSAYGNGAWASYLAAHPGANPGGYAAVVARQKQLGPWQVDLTDEHGKTFFRGHNHYLTNTTNIELGGTTLKNIFGWTQSYSHYNISEQGAPYLVQCTCNPTNQDYGNVEKTTAFSDELQIQGKTLSNNLSYIFGAFYYNARTSTHWPQTYFDLTPVFPAPTGFAASFRSRDESKALYSQMTYDLTSLGLRNLSLTGGIRYTWETIRLDQLPDGNEYNVYPTNSLTSKFNKPSWTIGLDYKPNTSLLLYVVQRGSWRSGGINGVAPLLPTNAAGGGAYFAPETAKDVEIGAKWHGKMLGSQAHFNIAGFKEWISNVQRAEFPTVNGHSIAVTINVPKAQVQGFEIDSGLQPASWLEIGGNLALTDAKYTKNTADVFGNIYAFDTYADTPKWAGTAFAIITLPMAQTAGTLKLRGEVYAQTHQYFSNNGGSVAPDTRLPGYALINARLDWTKILGTQFSAALFATNLANKAYYVGGLSQSVSLGENAAAPGRPRMYGVEVKVAF